MRTHCLLLGLLLSTKLGASAPQQLVPVGVYDPNSKDFIGDWIQSSDWFPVQLNVPDFFNGIGQNFQNLGNGFVNWMQRFPIINRFTSQLSPKPNRYMVWVPMMQSQPTHQFRIPNHASMTNLQAPHFNPFDGSNFLPTYP